MGASRYLVQTIQRCSCKYFRYLELFARHGAHEMYDLESSSRSFKTSLQYQQSHTAGYLCLTILYFIRAISTQTHLGFKSTVHDLHSSSKRWQSRYNGFLPYQYCSVGPFLRPVWRKTLVFDSVSLVLKTNILLQRWLCFQSLDSPTDFRSSWSAS